MKNVSPKICKYHPTNLDDYCVRTNPRLRYICNICNRERAKKYYYQNKEVARDKNRLWGIKNREKKNKYSRKYYSLNKERISEKAKVYYKNNKLAFKLRRLYKG